MRTLLYFLFFCSGLSGLIYQIVWVRVFGNVFGNTLYSTSLVVAIFMLGLGVGSYGVGVWADRRYTTPSDAEAGHRQPKSDDYGSMLRAYAHVEGAIAMMGFAISLGLPHLVQLSGRVSSYTRDANGWYVLAMSSHIDRAVIAAVLLLPITLLMGGTLTLLIRHHVRSDPEVTGWRIAVLYGVNTAGAAVGCALTDLALVSAVGLWKTQMIAVFFNVVAAVGAAWLIPFCSAHGRRRAKAPTESRGGTVPVPDARKRPATVARAAISGSAALQRDTSPVGLVGVALALTGFSAMGMEILWFRHFSILLGGFRAVFSLVLAVVLIGIGTGSIASSFVHRHRKGLQSCELPEFRPDLWPAWWLMAAQALFVASTLFGLTIPDPRDIDAIANSARSAAASRLVEATAGAASGLPLGLAEVWFNLKPILFEVGLPALFMGFSFPLGNSMIQHAEHQVGRRAGFLYLSNTVGAVCGSLAAGFLLLPTLGIQVTVTVLMLASVSAIVPLYIAARAARTLLSSPRNRRLGNHVSIATLAGTMVVALGAVVAWISLPSGYLIGRAHASTLSMEHERVLTVSEGLTEVVAVTEAPGRGRRLLTDGHPMSATTRLAQRYMRALAHIPLLSMDTPATVLVIGFGVGNTVSAATLHPSVRRVEVADLSKNILAHSSYFAGANMDVINDPKVVVYVNDGRHHLQMQPEGSYDLITLEPPPIGFAGVAALYSKEFYALARTRLKPKGYISQWLPAYQVPIPTTLAMIRAFVDLFPQAVLLSGAKADLLLLGTNDSRIEIDPDRLTAALANAPAVKADLQRLDLGSVREIVGTFMGSSRTLADTTRDVAAVTDDHPIQEYAVKSLLNTGGAVPGSVLDLRQLSTWCPKCFTGRPADFVNELDTYLALLDLAYTASPVEADKLRLVTEKEHRTIEGSAYLGEVVPESAQLHNILGIARAGKGLFEEAISEFREALRLDPNVAETYRNLGAALASRGDREQGISYLRRSVELDPDNGQARFDLANTLLDTRKFDEAADQFRATLRLMPSSAKAYNNLGVALVSSGRFAEAVSQFERALALDPELIDARRNLAEARRRR